MLVPFLINAVYNWFKLINYFIVSIEFVELFLLFNKECL